MLATLGVDRGDILHNKAARRRGQDELHKLSDKKVTLIRVRVSTLQGEPLTRRPSDKKIKFTSPQACLAKQPTSGQLSCIELAGVVTYIQFVGFDSNRIIIESERDLPSGLQQAERDPAGPGKGIDCN
ncbi:MAG TPA: hypothetical protein VLJ80_08375 [Solirubrobacteraceae bacterium]|nr:hypothetical protein [Solirubrobacteraceae bacterium]